MELKGQDVAKILVKNGLNDKQALVYAVLIEVKESTASSLALRTGLGRTSIYLILDELIRINLIEKSESLDVTRFKVAPIGNFILKKEVEIKESQEALRDFRKIQTFIDANSKINDQKKPLSKLLVGYLQEKIKSPGIVVFKVNKAEKTVETLSISSNKLADFVLKKTNFFELKSHYPSKEHLISRSVVEKTTFIDDKVEHFICPTVSKNIAEKIQWMGRIGSLASIPILQAGKVIGVILISFRDSKDLARLKVAEIEEELSNFAPILKVFTDA